MSSLDFLEKAVSLASKEFLRGFIIGQFALLLVLFLLGRFLFFRGPSSAGEIRINRDGGRVKRTKGETPSLGRLARKLEGDNADIPRKESCLWANAIASKLFLEPLREALSKLDVLQRISILLNAKIPKNNAGHLGEIEIKELRLSEHDPLIRWVQAIDDVSWELRVEWEEPAELVVDSSLTICWPPNNPMVTLPFSFTFTAKALEATLRVELDNLGGSKRMSISLLPEAFCLDLDIHSLVGHRSKLKDVPKLTAIISNRIRQAICQHILFPNRVYFNADIEASIRSSLAALAPLKSVLDP